VLSWTGGTAPGVTYTYTIYRSTTLLALTTDYTVSGTASPVTITFTNNAQYSYTFVVTATLGASTLTSATSASVQSANPIFPSGLSTTGLLAYYPFNTDMYDYVTGTAVTDATSTTSCSIVSNSNHFGNAGSLYINATGSTSYFGTKSLTLPANSGFTIAFWIKYANTDQVFLSWNLNANDNRYMVYPGGAVTFFYQLAAGSFYYPGTSPFTYNTWTHIAFAVAPSTGGTSTGYINGVATTTISTGNITQPTTYSAPVRLAADNANGSTTVKNYYSNLYIFNRQLTQSEITALYGQ